MELPLLRIHRHRVLILQDEFQTCLSESQHSRLRASHDEPLIGRKRILSQTLRGQSLREDRNGGLIVALWVGESKKGFFARGVYLQVQRPDEGRPYGREKAAIEGPKEC